MGDEAAAGEALNSGQPRVRVWDDSAARVVHDEIQMRFVQSLRASQNECPESRKKGTNRKGEAQSAKFVYRHILHPGPLLHPLVQIIPETRAAMDLLFRGAPLR